MPTKGWPVNDTPENIRACMISMMRGRSGHERLRMGASMFDSARALALHSLRSCNRAELSERLFLRFYGADFPAHKRDKIAASLGMVSLLDRLVLALVAKLPEELECVILYGSRAGGSWRQHSDVDILVVLKSVSPEARRTVGDIAAGIGACNAVSIISATAGDFRKERMPLYTAVKREGRIIYGSADMSLNPAAPPAKYANFFRQSREFESRKVDAAERMLREDFPGGVPALCFVAAKHAVQAALAMQGIGYSSKMAVLLPLAAERFGEDVAEKFKLAFDVYTRSEYGLDEISKEEAVLAIECARAVLSVYGRRP